MPVTLAKAGERQLQSFQFGGRTAVDVSESNAGGFLFINLRPTFVGVPTSDAVLRHAVSRSVSPGAEKD